MTVMDNEDPADPSVHEPRVTGAPETVWLVYGDLDRDATHRECCDSGEVTWCEDAQFSADVRYLRADLLYQLAREIASTIDAEIERCAALRTVAAQVLRDMQAQGVLLEWQTLLDEALRAERHVQRPAR